jgi:hypothetical protein
MKLSILTSLFALASAKKVLMLPGPRTPPGTRFWSKGYNSGGCPGGILSNELHSNGNITITFPNFHAMKYPDGSGLGTKGCLIFMHIKPPKWAQYGVNRMVVDGEASIADRQSGFLYTSFFILKLKGVHYVRFRKWLPSKSN